MFVQTSINAPFHALMLARRSEARSQPGSVAGGGPLVAVAGPSAVITDALRSTNADTEFLSSRSRLGAPRTGTFGYTEYDAHVAQLAYGPESDLARTGRGEKRLARVIAALEDSQGPISPSYGIGLEVHEAEDPCRRKSDNKCRNE